MAEPGNRVEGKKRVIFPKGEQRNFLIASQVKLELNLRDFADLAGIHVRSMTDWKIF